MVTTPAPKAPCPADMFDRAVRYILSLRPDSRPDRVHALAALGADADGCDPARASFWSSANLAATLRAEIDAAPLGCIAFVRALGARAAEVSCEAVEALRRRPGLLASLAVPAPIPRRPALAA